jgi:tetratricopeptide (TPR) repeat protein
MIRPSIPSRPNDKIRIAISTSSSETPDCFDRLLPTETRGTFGGALNYFGYGKIEGYDASGSPTGDVAASDLMLDVAWGKRWNAFLGSDLFKDLSTGVSLKVLRKTLADKSALGEAADIGFSYPVRSGSFAGMRLAGAVQNLGPGIKFDGEASPLPQTMRLGAAYPLWGRALTLAADAVVSGNDPAYFLGGLEYRILKMFAVRFGYKGSQTLDKKLTYGLGFENPRFRLDYAFVPFGDLGDTHRISLVFRFGRVAGRTRVDTQLQDKLNEAKTLYSRGQLVDAYMTAIQIQQVAPWMSENARLLASISKDFKDLEDNDRKEKMLIQVQALFARGEKFFQEGNLLNAQLEFKAVLGLQPENRAAQGYLRQIQGQFSSFVQNFYQAGMSAMASGDYDRAKEEFEKVLVIKPDHAPAKEQLERCVNILQNRQREAQEARQKDAVAKIYDKAVRALHDEDYEGAILLFSDVLRINPRHQQARRYLEQAREVLFKRYYNRGQEYAGKGQWDQAIKSLKQALESDPDSREARSLLADIQRRWDLQKKVVSQNYYKEGLEAFLAGDKKKAKTLWEKALDADSENEEARRGLARLQ